MRIICQMGTLRSSMFFLLVALSVLCAGCSGKKRPDAILEDIRGKVEVRTRPDGVWQTVNKGTEVVLEAGMSIRTSPDGHALIRYYDGAKTEVFGDTIVTVEALEKTDAGGTSRMIMKMIKGMAVYLVEKDRIEQFEVRTDTAIAAIKGTVFKVEAGEDGTTTLKVREGVVAFSTINGEGLVTLEPYHMSVLRPGQLPTKPAKFNAITDSELSETKVIMGTGVLK